MLKPKQKEDVSRLPEGKDELAVLPSQFGKSLKYISKFCSSARPNWLVIEFQKSFHQ